MPMPHLTPTPGFLKEAHELRTHRRTPVLAATFATAVVAVALAGGVQPAAAATGSSDAVADCAATSVTSEGMLDPGLLQTCLEQVQSSLWDDVAADEPAAEEPAAADAVDGVIDEIADFVAPTFDALDVTFQFDGPEAEAGFVADESAPADDGLGDVWSALRECESGGDYSINTGNGYYGAYQFSLATWQWLGYDGYPHEASAAVQDQAARELQALSGWGQWPGCSWYLGLG